MHEPRKVTAVENPQCSPQAPAQSRLTTVAKLARRHDGLSEGGLRHMLFHLGQNLEREGIVIRFGSRILIDENRFLDWLRAGQARTIVGGGR
jgi:hypothetical protein